MLKPIICLPSPSGEAGIIEYLMEENMVYKPLSEGSLTKLFGWNIFIDLFLSECVSVTKWINKRALIWRLPPAICKYFFMVSVCFKLLLGFAKGKTIFKNSKRTSWNSKRNLTSFPFIFGWFETNRSYLILDPGGAVVSKLAKF